MSRNRIERRIAPLVLFMIFITGCTPPPAGIGGQALGGRAGDGVSREPMSAGSAVTREVLADLSPPEARQTDPVLSVTPRAKPASVSRPEEPFELLDIDISPEFDIDGDGQPDWGN